MVDYKNVLICPACGEIMKKLAFPEYNFSIDICVDGCGGIWFDNNELQKFDEQTDNIEKILKEFENKTFKEVDKSITRYCPVCAVKMVKNYCSVKHEIQVDECYNCGGKFFDRGELISFRAQYKDEKERTEAVEKLAENLFGSELARLDGEVVTLKAYNQKSILYKLFSSIK